MVGGGGPGWGTYRRATLRLRESNYARKVAVIELITRRWDLKKHTMSKLCSLARHMVIIFATVGGNPAPSNKINIITHNRFSR